MPYYDTTWYVNFGDGSTTGYYAVAKRPQNTAVVAGQIVRQFTTPAVGSERCFVCIVAGTTANTTDAAWASLTRGTKHTDGTAQWHECTGQAAVNGDLANAPSWSAIRAISALPNSGAIIKRNNGASYQICQTNAATMGASEPAFSNVAGTSTADGAVTWICLGPVGNFTGGQAPHARLNNVFGTNWFASGNTVYVGDNHAETAASVSLTAASALMARILCHNRSGSYPPAAGDLTTGATITVTGFISLQVPGSFYFRGLTFIAASTAIPINVGPTSVGQVQNWYYFDSCSFQTTAASSVPIQLGNGNAASWAVVVFDNTTVKFGATTHFIWPNLVNFIWRNTGQVLVSGSAVPAVLIQPNSSAGAFYVVMLEGLDLSQLTGSLLGNGGVSSMGSLLIKDCKLHSSTTVTTPINTGMTVQLAQSASDATSYKSSRHTYEGVETTETSIVRTGGYADPQGQVQSRKIITTANAQWLRPYATQPLSVWNGDVGSPKTVTVCGTVNAGALPANDDIWLECSYLGDSSFPVGSMVTTTKDNVWDANAAGVSDGSSWSTPSTLATLDGFTSGAVLSNGDLTVAAAGSGVGGASSTRYLDSGKYYFEVTVTTTVGIFCGCGIGPPGLTFSTMTGHVGVGYAASSNITGGIYDLGLTSNGDIIRVAVDLDAKLIWFLRIGSGVRSNLWNGNASADPVTGVNGATIPAGYLSPYVRSSGVGAIQTANFGQVAYAGTPPTGFVNWASVWIPFKLAATLTPQMPGYLIPQVKVAKASTTYYIDPLAVVT